MAPLSTTTTTITGALPLLPSSTLSPPPRLPTILDLYHSLLLDHHHHHPHLQNNSHDSAGMAEGPRKSRDDRDDDFPSDSDMGSVIDRDDVETPSAASRSCGCDDDDDGDGEEGEEEEEVTSSSFDSAPVLVVVGCRMCLTYFMVESSTAECPRCGDRRELVRFGG